jgi:hypothetical protein
LAEKDYKVSTCAPGDLADGEFATCVAIVTDGGAVKKRFAVPGLRSARVLAVVRQGARIVGVGAIKQVRPDYAKGRARLANYEFPADTPELGYVSRHPDHKKSGLGPQIVAALLSRHQGPFWATTDSKRMKEVLTDAGFVHKGNEWPGDRGQLSLWLKD